MSCLSTSAGSSCCFVYLRSGPRGALPLVVRWHLQRGQYLHRLLLGQLKLLEEFWLETKFGHLEANIVDGHLSSLHTFGTIDARYRYRWFESSNSFLLSPTIAAILLGFAFTVCIAIVSRVPVCLPIRWFLRWSRTIELVISVYIVRFLGGRLGCRSRTTVKRRTGPCGCANRLII